MIGPNGAGKSTFVNTVSGVYEPTKGRVYFQGQDITSKKSTQNCHQGLTRTFQHTRSFPKYSVLKNVMIGAIFGRGKRISNSEARDLALEALDFVEFKLSYNQPASSLNTVQLKRVELARCLATGCEMLFLDEIAAGLTTGELNNYIKMIKKIREEKQITLLVIEHLMKFIMGVSDRIAVLNFGDLIAVGTPEEISNNPKVKEAYLGKGEN